MLTQLIRKRLVTLIDQTLPQDWHPSDFARSHEIIVDPWNHYCQSSSRLNVTMVDEKFASPLRYLKHCHKVYSVHKAPSHETDFYLLAPVSTEQVVHSCDCLHYGP